MDIEFRNYISGDEKSILYVFKRCFQREMNYNYWKWRYLDNIYIKGNLINLAWDEKELAAHYALSPNRIYINGEKHNAALSMTTMTNLEYQGKGLFTKLARDLFEQNEKTIKVIYGVPNKNSIYGFTNKLEFRMIKEIPMFEGEIKQKRYDISRDCIILDEFDSRFDQLFEDCINNYNIISTRKSEYLNWRIKSNPENNYKIIGCLEDNKLAGYLVTKIYKENKIISGDIVDFLVRNSTVFDKLLNFAMSSFQSDGVRKVNTWCSEPDLIKELNKYNIVETQKSFPFIVRNNSDDYIEEIYDFNNWYITMIDIDLF